MSTYDCIINNIKRIIEEKGMKQVAIAERAGFKASEFSNMLNGRKLLRAEYIPKIASALGVDLNEIFNIYEEYKREDKAS